jgi:hypothetical protein
MTTIILWFVDVVRGTGPKCSKPRDGRALYVAHPTTDRDDDEPPPNAVRNGAAYEEPVPYCAARV